MITLAIISDDFTGALDTGVQFSNYGTAVRIYTGHSFALDVQSIKNTDVLVIDAETRALDPEEAYRVTVDLVHSIRNAGIPYLYIKTDSGLRGNIGAVLKAAVDAGTQDFIGFTPAYPDMNRVTRDGMHLIEGIPIHASAFGKDPFEPVHSPYVRDLFRNTDLSVLNIGRAAIYEVSPGARTVGIFDAETNDDFRQIARHLKERGQLAVTAGCAGFAAILPEFIPLPKQPFQLPLLNKPLLTVSGSLNPITKRQLDHAEQHGFQRLVLTPEQLLTNEYFLSAQGKAWVESLQKTWNGRIPVIVDTGISRPGVLNDCISRRGISPNAARFLIARAIGQFLAQMLAQGFLKGRTLLVIGGDTLLGFIGQLHWQEISPVCELVPGTVLSTIRTDKDDLLILSKSGGFGGEDQLTTILHKMNASPTERK